MPTIPKLVAAICLMLTAIVASKMVMALLPESTDFGMFLPLNMAFGFLTGWFYTGALSNTRIAEAVSYGLTGAAVTTFLALFAQSGNEMVRLALRHRYGGPFEAIAAVFQIAVDYAGQVLTVEVVATLAVGGVLAGILSYMASRRWK